MSRPKIPEKTQEQLLTESRRRCALCFWLDNDRSVKEQGQLAHIDRNHNNNADSNLAYLCLDHHDRYDSRTSQSKGFKPAELRVAKQALYDFLSRVGPDAELSATQATAGRLCDASSRRTTLRITQNTECEGQHHVELALEGEGLVRQSATASIVFQLTLQELEEIRWYLEDYLLCPYDPAPTIAAQIEQRMAEIGMELFKAVFQSSEQGRRLWARVYEQLSNIRVEIVTSVCEAVSVPWELLRDPFTDNIIALNAAAFVRTQNDPVRTPKPIPEEDGPIRVLLVTCRPKLGDDVPLRSVASRLIKSLSDQAHAAYQLDVLRPPTYDQLAKTLRLAKSGGQPYHVVHFDGHGMYAEVPDSNKVAGWLSQLVPFMLSGPRVGPHGYLLFENPATPQNIQLIDGKTLGNLLYETDTTVLVLNACRTAHAELPEAPGRSHTETGSDLAHTQIRAFGSLAQEVVDAGVTGVVAMRYNVYVATAAQFVAELYGNLVRGLTLGESVSLARKQLAANADRTIGLTTRTLQDWSVPLVYEAEPTSLFPISDAGTAVPIAIADAAIAMETFSDRQLPKPPDVGCCGRDETLIAIDRSFDSHSVVLLHAYAGSGKTVTTGEFARWYMETGGIRGPVLFTSFEQYTPLPRLLDRIGDRFGKMLTQAGIDWLTLEDEDRLDVALQLLRKVPVFWIWDNVETIAGIPAGSASDWTHDEQRSLADFLRHAAETKARFLLTSRRDELSWLGDLPTRIQLPPMPMEDRAQLVRRLAQRRSQKLTDLRPWWPLLRFTDGNPLTLTVLAGAAIRTGLNTTEQFEKFIREIQAGETKFDDEPLWGRSRSLNAALSYGFENAFTLEERKHLALLGLFQGVVDVAVLACMGQMDARWRVKEIEHLDREYWLSLLDRAIDVGLVEGPRRGGVYWMHPTISWFMKQTRAARGDLPEESEGTIELAFVKAMTYFIGGIKSEYGREGAFLALGHHEWNLRSAIALSRRLGCFKECAFLVKDLLELFDRSGRRAEWHRVLREHESEYVDPESGEPLPGREPGWQLLAEMRAMATRQVMNLAEAEHIHKQQITHQRKQVETYLALSAEGVTLDQLAGIENLVLGLTRLGECQCLRGNKDCISSLEEAYTLATRFKLHGLLPLCAYNIGLAYQRVTGLIDFAQAEHWYKLSGDHRSNDDVEGLAQTLHQRAVVAFRQFEAARQEVHEASPESDARNAAIDRMSEHYNRAASLAERAIKTVPPDAIDDLARMHHTIGLLFGSTGRMADAQHHYYLSIGFDEKQGDCYGAARTRRSFAVDLLRAGELEKALDWAQAALKNFEKYGERAREEIDGIRELICKLEEELKKRGDVDRSYKN